MNEPGYVTIHIITSPWAVRFHGYGLLCGQLACSSRVAIKSMGVWGVEGGGGDDPPNSCRLRSLGLLLSNTPILSAAIL